MNNLNRDKIKDAFSEYVAHYNPEDPKIRLKIDHTYRVAELSDRIAREIPEMDVDLAWLMGMLHDIGRFEQVRRYGTFFDAKSVDHAMLGADLLFQEGLLQEFGSFSDIEQRTLELAIRNHNKYRIDEDIPEEIVAYCHVLRDADKIDIFRANCDTRLEDIYDVSTEELQTATVSEAVKESFRERHTVLRKFKETPIDNVVALISLVFELVYPISLTIVKDQGYVDQLLQYTSHNPDTEEWFAYMRQEIWK